MSIFSSMMNKIFNRDEAGAASGGSAAPGKGQASGTQVASGAASPSSGSSATSGAGGAVDVEAVLSGMAAKKGQKLDWRHSVVDLMKLLDLDSSLGARKELAKELNYTGDTNDSAKMNVWLHTQVMRKLAENGGKVPESLRT